MDAALRRTGSAAVSLSRGLDRAASAGAVTALVVLVGAVMLQVVARYAFRSPPPWTEELARYAMIWTGLLGATISFKRRFDPALFSNPGGGSPALAVAAGLVQSGVVLVYLAPILWHCFYGPGMNPARGFLLRHARTSADALDFSTLWVAIAVPIMVVLVLVHLAARWAGDDASAPMGDL